MPRLDIIELGSLCNVDFIEESVSNVTNGYAFS